MANVFGFPSLDEFEILVRDVVEKIPEKFLKGLGGIFVQPVEKRRDDVRDVYILGEYIRRPHFEPIICLYYESFKKIHGGQDENTIRAATWELVTHELQHHLERHFEVQDLVKEDEEYLRQIKIEQGLLKPREYVRPSQLLNLKKVGLSLLADVIVKPKKLVGGAKIRLLGENTPWREIIVNIPAGSYGGKILRLPNMGNRDGDRTGDFYLFLHDKRQKTKTLKLGNKRRLFVFGNGAKNESPPVYHGFLNNEERLELPALNEKKIDLDYYYDAVISTDALNRSAIFIDGLGKEKRTIKLKLTEAGEDGAFSLKVCGLGESEGAVQGDVYLTIYLR